MKAKSKFKFAITCLIVLIFCVNIFGKSSTYPEFPYPASNYDENYRGQFHFSSKGGWVNDVNGIWYYGGVYHLAYQHHPHGLDWGPMHWGHATSTDMMHWTQQPIMLEPGDNVPGDCFSGSTVVDINNTSGFKTGTNPVFVTIYTATTKGTCLAYSNDLGATWQAHSGNNVNVGGPDHNTRDPHVFWYAPTSKWVCLLYENGTTFYTSPDLKNWTKVSNYSFGFECPDFFELPVDGGATKKWVLQDASGKYHIGDFNGTVFTPTDTDGPYKMDLGPDFYAAQTFYRPTFPDNRLVQLAWLDAWNGGTETSPWRKEFTFPAELKLVTTAAGIRVARYPISEISTLYSSTKNWGPQILSQESDLLAGIGSKTFDMTYQFDLQNTTATSINLQIANKIITYDVVNQTLLGQPLPAISNKVKIRVLTDWGQLEVFGNDGIFSWSEQVAFTPSDWTVSLTANGDLNLVAATFSNVNRTWPGTVPFVHVTGVSLNTTSNVLSLGTKFKIKPVIEPSNAPNKVVSWSSNNNSIATVNSMGEVTAVALGTATITATTVDGAKTANCSITVIPTPNYQIYDFESGDLTDWIIITGTAFSNGDVCSDINWSWGGPFNHHGNYHMWGFKDLEDAPFGEMKTSNFTIAADGKIKFLIAGGIDSTNLYIGLYRASDDALLMKEVGNNDEAYIEKTFDAYSYLGTECYLKAVDKASGGFGHINLDYIRIPLSSASSIKTLSDIGSRVVVSPVPAKDIFTIDLASFIGDRDVSVEIIDISGKRIAKVQVTEEKYSFSAKNLRMNPGIYFINILSEKQVGSVKIIIDE